jgi:Ca2+/H+ antiporter
VTDRPSCGCNADLLPFVALTLVLGYAVPESLRPPPIIIFISALLSISPIAYYIGMAVARYLPAALPSPLVTPRAATIDMFPMPHHVSIAAQTNFAIGAMLTAIFGVSIEIILYSMYVVPSTVAGPHL